MLALTLIGCASVTRIPFPENEYSQLQKEGSAIVKGQVFMKTRGGNVKYGAGEEILLNPVTSYSKQWFEVNYLGKRVMSAQDPRQKDYIKTTLADGEGRFIFKKVPAGRYYVVGNVTWEAVPNQMFPEGGIITKQITVNENEEVEIILTR